VTWVVFDLGETLVDETANWDRWADYLEVPRFTFHAVFGGVIAAGRPHTDTFTLFRPGVEVEDLVAQKNASVGAWTINDDDLYDDALPTLNLLRRNGYRLAVFANQPHSAEPFMATLPVDLVATSAAWGVAKPEPAFFARITATLDVDAAEIAYVGDRLDLDVLPAKQAGMFAVHLRRGPWGHLVGEAALAAAADARIDSLLELPEILG
jgi:HAD superfamily hydrolase (TIGR01549 family)